MAQRRFSRYLVAGIIVGYLALLLIVLSIMIGSWYKVRIGPVEDGREKMVGLFDHDSGAAKACQAFMILSFIANIAGCVVGMASSYAVTRPKVAGMAVKRLRLKPKKLTLGPKFAGFCYIAAGLLVMIAAITASAKFATGYSVILAWVSFVTCIVSGALLIWAEPPAVPHLPEPGILEVESEQPTGERGKIFVGHRQEETLPREVAMADTLAYKEKNERNRYDVTQAAPETISQSDEADAKDQSAQESQDDEPSMQQPQKQENVEE